jgi:serine O-acetyltransferase
VNINPNGKIIKVIRCWVQNYNHETYWKKRAVVVDLNSKKSKLIKLIYLFQLKRVDAFHNASMGTDLGAGAKFKTPPKLYHGLNGIIISHYAEIGENCVINQQVTIAEDGNKGAAKIGDNVFIGAGAKIIGKVRIGNNVKIGANAVVVNDLPDNCLAVGVPAVVKKYIN